MGKGCSNVPRLVGILLVDAQTDPPNHPQHLALPPLAPVPSPPIPPFESLPLPLLLSVCSLLQTSQ